MNDQPAPQVGDIWRELDRRFSETRYVKVIATVGTHAKIRRVEFGLEGWNQARRASARYARMDRFNGKNGGYAFVERTQP